MTIQHKQSGSKGAFVINDEGEMIAELIYSVTHDNQMMIEHTEVEEELRGGNLGYELVHKAVEYARTHHYTVIPLCRFARAVLEKKPEFKDVIALGYC
jgi:predicted GNAT family acetyltransferase